MLYTSGIVQVLSSSHNTIKTTSNAMNHQRPIMEGSAVNHGHSINQPMTPAVVSTMYSIKSTLHYWIYLIC